MALTLGSKSKCQSVFGEYRNAGFLAIFYSVLQNPFAVWDKQRGNGLIIRGVDEDSHIAIQLHSNSEGNIYRTFITTPTPPFSSLGITLPILVLILKDIGRKFGFAIQIRDNITKRNFLFNNGWKTNRIKTHCAYVPIRMENGWNELNIDLAALTKRYYGTQYQETVRIQIFANCRIRFIYFSATLLNIEKAIGILQEILITAKDKLPTSQHSSQLLISTQNISLLKRGISNLVSTWFRETEFPTRPQSCPEITSKIDEACVVKFRSLLRQKSEEVLRNLFPRVPELEDANSSNDAETPNDKDMINLNDQTSQILIGKQPSNACSELLQRSGLNQLLLDECLLAENMLTQKVAYQTCFSEKFMQGLCVDFNLKPEVEEGSESEVRNGQDEVLQTQNSIDESSQVLTDGSFYDYYRNLSKAGSSLPESRCDSNLNLESDISQKLSITNPFYEDSLNFFNLDTVPTDSGNCTVQNSTSNLISLVSEKIPVKSSSDLEDIKTQIADINLRIVKSEPKNLGTTPEQKQDSEFKKECLDFKPTTFAFNRMKLHTDATLKLKATKSFQQPDESMEELDEELQELQGVFNSLIPKTTIKKSPSSMSIHSEMNSQSPSCVITKMKERITEMKSQLIKLQKAYERTKEDEIDPYPPMKIRVVSNPTIPGQTVPSGILRMPGKSPSTPIKLKHKLSVRFAEVKVNYEQTSSEQQTGSKLMPEVLLETNQTTTKSSS